MTWELGDYTTIDDLRVELHARSHDQDDILSNYIHEASADIDQYTNRKFYEHIETRYYHAYDDVDWRELLLDDDLQGIIEVTINNGQTVIPAEQMIVLPNNFTPKNCIKLTVTSTYYWSTFFTDPNRSIAVNGTWGFNLGTIPPKPIGRACVKLAAYRYNKTFGVFGDVGGGDVGAYQVSTDIPEEIQKILQPFRRKQIYATSSYSR